MSDHCHPELPLRVAIITYDHAHLKTEQMVHRFLLNNKLKIGRELDLVLLALPFSARPSRTVLFVHRPDQARSIRTRELAARHRLEFLPCDYDSIPDVADIYFIAGAGIFSAKAIGKKKIVNVHPGIIPSARGLDAFKWSILDDVPLGVTLHYIDAEVDAGETIAVVETPIFPSDTMEMLARRHYELEVDVGSKFLSFLKGKAESSPVVYPENASRMRMPIRTERDMIAKFDGYKRKLSERAVSATFGNID
jgi:phosphoribosylglycinamide formyltransferase-1